jgi:hypothetical protein
VGDGAIIKTQPGSTYYLILTGRHLFQKMPAFFVQVQNQMRIFESKIILRHAPAPFSGKNPELRTSEIRE